MLLDSAQPQQQQTSLAICWYLPTQICQQLKPGWKGTGWGLWPLARPQEEHLPICSGFSCVHSVHFHISAGIGGGSFATFQEAAGALVEGRALLSCSFEGTTPGSVSPSLAGAAGAASRTILVVCWTTAANLGAGAVGSGSAGRSDLHLAQTCKNGAFDLPQLPQFHRPLRWSAALSPAAFRSFEGGRSIDCVMWVGRARPHVWHFSFVTTFTLVHKVHFQGSEPSLSRSFFSFYTTRISAHTSQPHTSALSLFISNTLLGLSSGR